MELILLENDQMESCLVEIGHDKTVFLGGKKVVLLAKLILYLPKC